MDKIRKFIYVILIFGIALLLSVCQDAEDIGEDDWEDYNPIQEDKELVIRHKFYSFVDIDYNGTKLREIYDRIEEEHGYTILAEPQSTDGYTAILADDLSRGELPHIMEFGVLTDEDINFMHKHKDNFLDLTDYLNDSGLTERFHSLDSFTVDGRVYGLPVTGATLWLYYNRELVEKFGDVPGTLKEFLSIMMEAKQAGYNPIAIDEDLSYELFQGILLETAGIDKLNALMNGEAKWTDDEFVEAFQFLEKIAQLELPRFESDLPEIESDFNDIVNEFITGDNIVFMSSSLLYDADETIGVMRFPVASEAEVSSGITIGKYPVGFLFNGDVTEEEEKMIYQFIETFWSEEIMSEYYAKYYIIPAIRVEANTDNALINETITLLNETKQIIPEINELIPNIRDYTSDQYEYDISPQDDYRLFLKDVVYKVIEGSITMQQAVEIVNVFHERLLKKAQIN